MKAVITEKPSVAREIAAFLGATEKKGGYLTGNGYQVTWALGHLVRPAMPEDYGISGFQREALPILPNPFLLTVRKIKKDKGYVTDSGAIQQLKIIEQVIGHCDSIIVATDAGREGELIFRYIYEYLKCKKPFERLWISSLTEKAIKQGFDHLKPGSDFDGLYRAGQGRSQADWLVGINASRALSLVAERGVYSIGRVQTPTLALVCKRYLDHKNFSVQNYWQIQLGHRKEFIDFKSLSTTKWDDKKTANNALTSIERSETATVTAVESKTVSQPPPLLFDLTGLQKQANNTLGLSAAETLDIAQSLYEKKFITYPRTGSKYIPEDLWAEIPSLVRALEARPSCKAALAQIQWGHLNKRIVNDVKVTDHHGLLITEKIPSALSAKENALYDRIAFRLLEAVSHPCSKAITEITLQASHYDFALKGVKVLEAGWRAIRGSFTAAERAPIQELPQLKPDDTLKIKTAELLEKQTKPPVLYTEAGLLSAMENAGKDIKNQDQRKALKGIGIGTPATRAAILQTLFKREYIRREKKSLIPTEKGLQVYHSVKDKSIADVAMTAQWEMALQNIENNPEAATAFHIHIATYTTSITKELLEMTIAGEKPPKLTCPKCKSRRLLIRDKVVKCPDKGCNWLLFRNLCGVQISVTEVENLVCKNKTSLIKGMKSRSGKTFNAYIVMDDKGETAFEFGKAKCKKN